MVAEINVSTTCRQSESKINKKMLHVDAPQDPGLPDFSLLQHTKTGKVIPNGHKIHQMATKHTI
jgi:hypothetical protein